MLFHVYFSFRLITVGTYDSLSYIKDKAYKSICIYFVQDYQAAATRPKIYMWNELWKNVFPHLIPKTIQEHTLGIISPRIDDLYAVLAVNLNYALNVIKQQACHKSLSLPYHSYRFSCACEWRRGWIAFVTPSILISELS